MQSPRWPSPIQAKQPPSFNLSDIQFDFERLNGFIRSHQFRPFPLIRTTVRGDLTFMNKKKLEWKKREKQCLSVAYAFIMLEFFFLLLLFILFRKVISYVSMQTRNTSAWTSMIQNTDHNLGTPYSKVMHVSKFSCITGSSFCTKWRAWGMKYSTSL